MKRLVSVLSALTTHLFLLSPACAGIAREETLPGRIQESIRPILQRASFLRASFLGNEFWQYIIFLVILVLAIAAAKTLNKHLGKKIRWFSGKTGNRLIIAVTDNMRGPFELVIIVLGIRIGASFFFMTEDMRGVLSNSIELLIGVTVTYIIVKSVDVATAHFEPKIKDSDSQLDERLLPIIRKALKVFIIAVAFLVIIQNLGYNVLSLLTGLGIGGLAVALAAQQTLSNLFGSITLFADKPFSMGDWVEVDKYMGTIEMVGIRSTRLRTFDGSLVTIPNSKMADSYIDNIQKRPFIRKVNTLGVTYETGYEKMEETLQTIRDIYNNHPSTERAWVYFTDFGSHALEIRVFHWCRYLVFEEWLKATEDINLKIMKKLKEIGVGIAFPTQTLYVKEENANPGKGKQN